MSVCIQCRILSHTSKLLTLCEVTTAVQLEPCFLWCAGTSSLDRDNFTIEIVGDELSQSTPLTLMRGDLAPNQHFSMEDQAGANHMIDIYEKQLNSAKFLTTQPCWD